MGTAYLPLGFYPIATTLTQNRHFPRFLPKIDRSHNFDPRSIFSLILTQVRHFPQFWPRLDIFIIWLKNDVFHRFDQTRNFPEIWPKIYIFQNFDPKPTLSTILIKKRYFPKFSPQIRIFHDFTPSLTFFTILTKN